MNAKQRIRGQCLCGLVRYQISGYLGVSDHCHCSMCRKQHGAAFATYVNFNPKDFSWLSGVEYTKIYEIDSGAGWCFCNECGSSLAGTENDIVTSITMGTIDGDAHVKPQAHIFVESKANWHDIQDDLPQYAKRSQ